MISFEVTNDFSKTDGTFLQGCFTMPYDKMVERLGKPDLDGTDKTDAEWLIEFDDGTVATIYNWKNGKNYCGANGLNVEDMRDWNVGGKIYQAYNNVLEIFGK
jgi:hypothetical protein